MTPHHLPGSRWFQWIQNLTVRVGVLTGVYLSAVMIIALLAANRMPLLEQAPVADIRNWVARGAFAMVMAIPALIFFRHAVRLIAAAALGWTIFSLCYAVMGLIFVNLHLRFFTPFHLFVLGMCIYGVVAVGSWVASMAMEARTHAIAASRRKL
jgi:hypothetical protein